MTEDQRQPICCGNCPFFARQVNAQRIGSKQGECRRFPPQLYGLSQMVQAGKVATPGPKMIKTEFAGQFPPVQEAAICGEHPGFRQALAQMKTEDKTNGDPTQV